MNLVFKIMTTISFVGVVVIAGASAYVYANKDAIIEGVKQEALEQITGALPLPMGGGTPSLPATEGAGALPVPTGITGF